MAAIDKIRKLLDKAASTEFAPEAESLLAAASALMAKHNIEDAEIRASRNITSEIVNEVVTLEGKYLKYRQLAFAQIVSSLGIETVLAGDNKIHCFGTRSMIDNALAIATMAELHMLVELPKNAPCDVSPGIVRKYNAGFIQGFGARLSRKLRDAQKVETENTEVSTSAALVLVDDKSRIEEALNIAFPNLTFRPSADIKSKVGYLAGTSAANSFNTNSAIDTSRLELQ